MSFILDNYGAQSCLTRWRQSSHDLLRSRYLVSPRQDTGVVSSLINLSLIVDLEHKTPDPDFVGSWCEEVTWAHHTWSEWRSSWIKYINFYYLYFALIHPTWWDNVLSACVPWPTHTHTSLSAAGYSLAPDKDCNCAARKRSFYNSAPKHKLSYQISIKYYLYTLLPITFVFLCNWSKNGHKYDDEINSTDILF